ncbi:alpha/beta fold hydrolase [Mycobacterium sp. 852013-51886_SCH5428379]|uniref:alpha/beta fold hydrolase n=1 Tax=Mycobacterium sp. 852013-51886_SCH5428379 TaxID=1834111 RepID=UPI0018D32B7D|nr:alpha/beta fold hydrolase [Mycobacterium sp. 852013-51886_SCH5428379]
MPLTLPDIEGSRPEALAQTAEELSTSTINLQNRIDQQHNAIETLRTDWHGDASQAAVTRAIPNLHRMRHLRDAVHRLHTTLDGGGAQLTRDRTDVLDTATRLRQQGWRVSPAGTVTVEPGSALDRYAATSPLAWLRVRQLAATGTATLTALLAEFDSTDRRVSRDIRTAVEGLIGTLPQAPTDLAVPDGSSAEVQQWWDRLSDTDRRRLLTEHPERLGNLDGVPVAVRSEANIAVLTADIARVEHATRAIPRHQMVRYDNAIAVRDGLRAQRDNTDAPTFLYIYEPEAFGGQGRAAVAIGDPDTADDTAVVVPGTGNNVGWLSDDAAAHVYNETAAADSTRTAAVVAWMGYDAPDSLADPQVGQPGLARRGGELLAADVNALAVTHTGDAHVTVIGHSYGSTTVADAAAGSGMRVDDVVLIGSPGTDLARSAADFHLSEGGHLFVGAASTDPVTHLGGEIALGDDPAADGFGSTRFKAEVAGWTDPISDHSRYLTPGSESLFSIATIASGHGDRLEALGLTAPHRDQLPFTLPGLEVLNLDPETWRPGTGGHTYR